MFRLMLFYILVFGPHLIWSQQEDNQPLDSLSLVESSVNDNRLRWLLVGGGTAYVGNSAALYYAWYKDYPQEGFHLHNDWGEWRHMDKLGHVYSTYQQADLVAKGLRWSGLSETKATNYGALSALLFQSTIEVMDGFSAGWGFSLSDMGANFIGVSSFVAQQHGWGEQRIRFKHSYTPVNYQTISEQQNANERFGTNFIQRALKDYNGQTTWISINLDTFLSNAKLPPWLNFAVGYGVQNLNQGYPLVTGPNELEEPRYSQFYLSLDADLSKIETDSPFLRTLLDFLNVLKMPFSTLEFDTRGGVKFHLIRF